MKQTRQAVHVIKQSILVFDIYGFTTKRDTIRIALQRFRANDDVACVNYA
jgi:hypothetical protein